MNTKNKSKTMEERLSDIELWQTDMENKKKLEEDYADYIDEYAEAPGIYNPDLNKERYINTLSKDYKEDEHYTSLHCNLDVGHKGEFNRKILKEDYINQLVNDTLKVNQTPESTLLPGEKQAVKELKSMAFLIRACEKYIKNNPDTITAFRDGVRMLKMQFEEAISHLNQVRNGAKSDFTGTAFRHYNLKKFKEATKRGDKQIDELVDDFPKLINDFI